MARDFLFRRARFRTILRLRRLAPHRARGRLPTPPPRALRPGVQGTLRGAGGVARRGFARIRCPNCRDPVPHHHDVTPGLVASIQTFGSYAANFHPHVHALVTDDAFTEEGEFLQLPYFDARLVEGVFRRRVLQRLHRAERLRAT